MKVLKKAELQQTGRMALVYGETGSGKTTSILSSAPDPILYVATEPRPLKPSLDAAGRPELDIDVAEYTTWSELIEFIAKPQNTQRYKTIVVDGFSHLMAVGLSTEIEDEAFESRTLDERTKKPLVSQVKMSLEGFGGLASHMFRLTAALGRLAQRQGKIVIVTALLQENPKWNRELAAAPALKGREFPANMPGFFDLIGLVQTRTDQDGNILYPPLVKFESPDGSFVAKFTGVKKPGSKAWGPLDFGKILNLNGGK